MNKDIEMTKKCILVGMDDAKISTEEKPIIGTHALATCMGVLLYSEERKVAIVAHVSCEPMRVLDKIFKLISDNHLLRTTIKYRIISGYYKEDHYNVKEILEKHFVDFIPFDNGEDNDYGIQKDEETTSCEFAFDASSGEFVTDNIFFGLEYYMINEDDDLELSKGIKKR